MLGDSEKITMNLEKHEAYVLIITGTYSATQLLDNASELSIGVYWNLGLFLSTLELFSGNLTDYVSL